MSCCIFIDSLKRNVYRYPNSANFIVDGRQTGGWNLIRSTTPALPEQQSRDQYYRVRVLSVTVPALPSLLKEPGIFVNFTHSKIHKVSKTINFIEPFNSEGQIAGYPYTNALTLAQIAAQLNVADPNDLTIEQIIKARQCESNMFHSNNKLSDADFFMVCDKIQNDENGDPVWIHYKPYITEQVIPLNLRGNSFQFQLLDVNGKVIQLTKWPGSEFKPHDVDFWDESKMTADEFEQSPVNPARQVYAQFELTYVPHKHDPHRHL